MAVELQLIGQVVIKDYPVWDKDALHLEEPYLLLKCSCSQDHSSELRQHYQAYLKENLSVKKLCRSRDTFLIFVVMNILHLREDWKLHRLLRLGLVVLRYLVLVPGYGYAN